MGTKCSPWSPELGVRPHVPAPASPAPLEKSRNFPRARFTHLYSGTRVPLGQPLSTAGWRLPPCLPCHPSRRRCPPPVSPWKEEQLPFLEHVYCTSGRHIYCVLSSAMTSKAELLVMGGDRAQQMCRSDSHLPDRVPGAQDSNPGPSDPDLGSLAASLEATTFPSL